MDLLCCRGRHGGGSADDLTKVDTTLLLLYGDPLPRRLMQRRLRTLMGSASENC